MKKQKNGTNGRLVRRISTAVCAAMLLSLGACGYQNSSAAPEQSPSAAETQAMAETKATPGIQTAPEIQPVPEMQTASETKTVEPATMFDINTTIMRCLVKNLAMFGLGLYIYAGEDLPNDEKRQQEDKEKELAEAFAIIKPNIINAPSRQYLTELHKQNPSLHNYPEYRKEMNKRFNEVE